MRYPDGSARRLAACLSFLEELVPTESGPMITCDRTSGLEVRKRMSGANSSTALTDGWGMNSLRANLAQAAGRRMLTSDEAIDNARRVSSTLSLASESTVKDKWLKWRFVGDTLVSSVDASKVC